MTLLLGELWKNAQDVTRYALRRADADVLGTERARARYESMSPAARKAMERKVIAQFGRPAWEDFMRALGKE